MLKKYEDKKEEIIIDNDIIKSENDFSQNFSKIKTESTIFFIFYSNSFTDTECLII